MYTVQALLRFDPMSKICRLLFCLLASTIAIAQNSPEFPAGISGEFVSRDVKTGKYFRVNPEGMREALCAVLDVQDSQ